MEAMTSEREAFEKWLTDGDTNPEAPPKDRRGRYVDPDVRDMWRAWEAATAHLAQPAQAVDVGLIAECAEALRRTAPVRPDLNTIADKLTRALSGEAWPVGDDTRRLQFVLDHVPHSVLADFGVLPPMWDLPEGEAHIDDARRTIDAVLAAGG